METEPAAASGVIKRDFDQWDILGEKDTLDTLKYRFSAFISN
jgi:hypothetical protein